jgi:restriction system protein
MAIPDFQSIMRPLLEHLSDGEERSNDETLEALSAHFKLSASELQQLLPSGKQTVFRNRVAWTKTHLKQAGLIDSPRRGVYRITLQGQDLLRSTDRPIDMRVLFRYPSYQEFRGKRDNSDVKERPLELPLEMTPEEHIEYGTEQIRTQLSAEILERIKQCLPDFFERLVVELLVAMGYGGSRRDAGQAVGRGGDGGVDGIIKEDKLGLDTIYIQAKRWEGVVGRPEVQKFAGALQGFRARKGIFITTSSFTKEAQQYTAAIESKIVLIDGSTLASLMIDHGIGVTTIQAFEIKRLDSDYFVGDE